MGGLEAAGGSGQRDGIAALFVVASALGVRCGSCFHVIWNQERQARRAGPGGRAWTTSAAIAVGVEALKLLIREDGPSR